MRAVCSRLPPGTNFRTDHDGNWNAWLQDSGEEIDLAPIMAEQIGRADEDETEPPSPTAGQLESWRPGLPPATLAPIMAEQGAEEGTEQIDHAEQCNQQ